MEMLAVRRRRTPRNLHFQTKFWLKVYLIYNTNKVNLNQGERIVSQSGNEDDDRRAFLKTCGKFAAVTPRHDAAAVDLADLDSHRTFRRTERSNARR